MNKVILLGRLTGDPEVRYSRGDHPVAVAGFSLAVNRRWKREGEPEADFFRCSAFGKLGEFAEKYLTKGVKVIVTGRLQNNNYTNKEGEKVYSVQIIVDEIEFAESKNSSAGNAGGTSYQADSRPSPSQVDSDGFMSIPEGEALPFD